MSTDFKYLGNNVGLIHGFYFAHAPTLENPETADNKDRRLAHIKDTVECIKRQTTRHLIAITANLYQTSSHETLRTNGFRAVVTFQSSHMDPRETLTLWVRRDARIARYAAGKEPAVGAWPYNCSVYCNVGMGAVARCLLNTTKPTDAAFKKMMNSPVWFKISPEHIVKPR